MKEEEDSLIVFISRNERWLEKEIIGRERSSTDNFL
jgi:CRISPR-associated protein Cas2